MDGREIDLIDMIAEILSHWRGVLVALMMGAFLLGAISFVDSYRGVVEAGNVENVTQDMSMEEQLAQLEEKLGGTQKVAVLMVIDDEAEYALRERYTETSAIMQIDPLNAPRRELVYKIKVDDMGQCCVLSSVYEDLINNVGLGRWVEEQTGVSTVNARELITADAKSSAVVVNGVSEDAIGNDSLKIYVYHADEKVCEELSKVVKAYVEDLHQQLSQELGAHEIVLMSESAGFIMDTGIWDKQTSNNNGKLSLLSSIAKAKEAFTAEQKLYYNLLTQNNVIVEEEVAVNESSPAVSVKYVLIGAVFFGFVYVGIVFILYLLNGKLRISDEIQKLYNVSRLGVIVKDSEKKFFVDRWIEALRNYGKRQFTREKSLELAAAAVKISVAKNELDSICLMGCDLKAGADVVCDSLKAMLEQEQVAVTILDNVLYDAVAMEKLENVKGAILVEKVDSTMCREISEELKLLQRQEIMVLGAVVVE